VGAAFASALAVAFAVLMVVGVVRAWDPLLHMDEWDGYAGFWYRLEDGETSAWWAQHNEHRIVLARLLFWFDARFLHGASWFMAACIVVAVCGSAALLVWALRARLREVAGCRYPAYGTWMIAAAIVAVATSWMQRQNLLWGFQIQFILGSLLPCLLVIAAPRAMTLLEGNCWPCVAALVAVPLLLLPRQLQALADPSADLAGRRLATVAVALGVPDPEALSLVSPDPRLPIQLGRRLMADRLTVVGEEPWRSLGERLGTHEPRLPAAGCDGALVEVRSVPDSPFFSIRGWTQAPGDVPVTAAPLPLVNPAGTTVGFAVSQTGALGQEAVLADSTPFAGYVRSASSLRGLNLQLPQGTCSTLWP
jgi:hypothetical protein